MNLSSSREEHERSCVQELAEAIMSYLAQHPQAADNPEGIAEWWLLRQEVRTVVCRVEQALRQLTERGLLEAVEAGASRLYRLKSPVREVRQIALQKQQDNL